MEGLISILTIFGMSIGTALVGTTTNSVATKQQQKKAAKKIEALENPTQEQVEKIEKKAKFKAKAISTIATVATATGAGVAGSIILGNVDMPHIGGESTTE